MVAAAATGGDDDEATTAFEAAKRDVDRARLAVRAPALAIIEPRLVETLERARHLSAPIPTGVAGAAPVTAQAGWTKQSEAPTGTEVARATINARILSAEMRGTASTCEVALVVGNGAVTIVVEVGAERWGSTLAAAELLEAMIGREAAAALGDATAFVADLAKRAQLPGTRDGTRFEIPLGGSAPDHSFVVIDLANVAQSVGKRSLAGWRPVEAQLLFGKTAGVRVFAGNKVTLAGEPIHGWFPIPDTGTIREALGVGGKGTVWGGVFFEQGILRVAVKPDEKATTGIVAHVDLLHVLDKLRGLGEQIGGWLAKLLDKINGGWLDFLKPGGLLRFALPDMPGISFDFDLKLSLPRLFRGGGGGGFSLMGLWPTGFSIGFEGFSLGALPSARFPWLRAPKVGSFGVAWPQLSRLFPGMTMPKLPTFDFGLHWQKGLSFGLGFDLDVAWPELGDLTLGFDLDFAKLLSKIKLPGIAAWLKKLTDLARGGIAFVQNWIHLGSDGVLRIYDGRKPGGEMLGFHLLRLLDGADATDLVPTEIRWTKTGEGSIELGEKSTDDTAVVKGKSTPARPDGLTIASRDKLAAPASLVTAMALSPGATLAVAVIAHGDLKNQHLTVWAEADSDLYDHAQAMRMTLDLRRIADAIKQRLPSKYQVKAALDIEIDETRSKLQGPVFRFGTATAAGKTAGRIGGAIGWSIESLVELGDWTQLPATIELDIEGAGGVQIGRVNPSGTLVGDRFELHSQVLRQRILQAGDQLDSVWTGIYYDDDQLAIAMTKDEAGTEGALAHVRLSFLLRQLERLGALGRTLLEKIADLADLETPGWRGGDARSDIFKLADLARALGRKLKQLARGVIGISFAGGSFIGWNVERQLPRIGLDLDFGMLVPDFDLPLPGLPDFSIAFRSGLDFGNPFKRLELPALDLGSWIDGFPHLKLPSPIQVDLAWVGDLLGITIQLGDLFGDGAARSIGLKLPLRALLDKLDGVKQWLGDRFGDVHAAASMLHLGGDGVLRIFDPAKPQGNRVGFDLKRLANGASGEDLVPSELELEVGGKTGKPLIEMSYGDAEVDTKGSAKRGAAAMTARGKVLVRRPPGSPSAHFDGAATPWLRDHLGLPDDAQMHAQLFVEYDRVVAFATFDGTDRGFAVRVTTTAITDAIKRHKPKATGVAIDVEASRTKRMIVVRLGQLATVGWRLDEILADPSLERFVPDELRIGNGKASVAVSDAIDTTGLSPLGEIDVAGWPEALARFASTRPELMARIGRAVRVAVVEPGETPLRRGIEIVLSEGIVKQLEGGLAMIAKRAGAQFEKLFSRTSGGGHVETWGIKVRASAAGLVVERGKEGDASHLYATFGWHAIANLAHGQIAPADLVPIEFRVATAAAAVEVKQLTPPGGGPKGRRIGELHPVLQQSIGAFGVTPAQWIDLAASPITEASSATLSATGMIYDVDATGTAVIGAKQVTLQLSIAALLAQVLPHQRSWTQDKPQPSRKRGTTISGSLAATTDLDHDGKADDPGIEMHAKLRHIGKRGMLEFGVTAGWTLQQLLDLVLHLDTVLDADGAPKAGAAGLLAPERLHGSVKTSTLELAFGTAAQASTHQIAARDIPGLPQVLGTVLGASAIDEAIVHLHMPDAGAIARGMKDAVAKGSFVEVGGCALQVPSRDPARPQRYGATLSMAPDAFKRFLVLVPYAGPIYKLVDSVTKIAKDLPGTIQALRYTPELLVELKDAVPEAFGAIKEKGFAGIAAALLMQGDVSAKQAIMAARIHRKMKAEGWTKPADAKRAGFDGVTEEYLAWLANQDGKALVAMYEYAEAMEKQGIALPDVPVVRPDKLVTVAELQWNTRLVEAGFNRLAEAERQTHDTNLTEEQRREAAAQVAKQSEALRIQSTS